MCIRDRNGALWVVGNITKLAAAERTLVFFDDTLDLPMLNAVSYTHLRAHETVLDLVCRLLLEQKKYPPTVTDVL